MFGSRAKVRSCLHFCEEVRMFGLVPGLMAGALFVVGSWSGRSMSRQAQIPKQGAWFHVSGECGSVVCMCIREVTQRCCLGRVLDRVRRPLEEAQSGRAEAGCVVWIDSRAASDSRFAQSVPICDGGEGSQSQTVVVAAGQRHRFALGAFALVCACGWWECVDMAMRLIRWQMGYEPHPHESCKLPRPRSAGRAQIGGARVFVRESWGADTDLNRVIILG